MAQQQQQQRASGDLEASDFGDLGGAGGAGAIGDAKLQDILNNPKVQLIREFASQDRTLLQVAIDRLAETDPDLALAVTQNQKLLHHVLGFPGGAELLADGDDDSRVLVVVPPWIDI